MQQQRQNQKKETKSSTTNNQQIQAKLLGTNVAEINIDKLRINQGGQQFNLNGRINQQIVKSMSNKFSMEIVFTLDLSNQKLNQIDCLSDCINLVVLNISNNQISDLSCLRRLKDLAFLNISSNQVSILDFGDLVKLQNLQAKNNLLKSIKSIDSLGKLEQLRTLYLQCPTGQQKNPLCDLGNYRNIMFSTLKQLLRLDGYSRDQQLYNGQELKQNGPEIKIELPNQGPWFVQNYPRIENNNTQILEDQKLKQNVDDTKKLIGNIEMKLSLLT